MGLPGCVTLEGEEGAGGSICTPGGQTIPRLQQGIKTLGCPLGSDGFSAGFLAKLAKDINGDLKAIETIPSKDLQLLLATWCTGSRTNYYLRAINAQRGPNTWRIIDGHFNDFLARVPGRRTASVYSGGSRSSVCAWAKGALAWSRHSWWSQLHSTHQRQCFNFGAEGTRGGRSESYLGFRWRV